jgi:dihydroflavonol-4-reductase
MALFLVTGATGHLGINLVSLLLKDKHRVVALVLPQDPLTVYLPADVTVIEGNVLNRESLIPFFNYSLIEPCYVIHCAGIITIYSQFNQLAYDVNVNGTQTIIDLCLKYPILKLVYVSSVHALKELKKGLTISELQSCPKDLIVGFYGQTKAEATSNVIKACEEKGLQASIVFPSGIIGPYDYGIGHTSQLLKDIMNRKMNVWISGGFDFVDVRDVAQGIVACAFDGQVGQGYLLSNRFISFRNLLNLTDTILKRKKFRPFIPTCLLNLALPLMEVIYRWLKQKPLFTKYALYTINSNSLFDHSKAEKELDYHPRRIEDTLRDTMKWIEENSK